MKKIFVLLISILTIVSCGDELEFNNPAMQGFKDGEIFRTNTFRADIDRGGLVIQGKVQGQVLTLITTRDLRGTYSLGGDNQSEALFLDSDGVLFSTINTPDPNVQVYPTEGEIIIENFDRRADNVVLATGTFWFNAFTVDGLESVNFNRGRFYRVPILDGIPAIGGGTSCQDAVTAVADAEEAFLATNQTMENYTDICNAYREALIVKINACVGANNQSSQDILDSLGDCIP